MIRGAATDTIFAVAAGGRHAAITVLRVSGPDCAGLLAALGLGRLVPRHASLRSLRDGSGRLLDRALVLWFPGPRSYTGEDCAELHLHGGAAVLEGVTIALCAFGARPADPGEFTRRAFVNGRIDLLEAEAIGDLVAAETDAQRDQALMQMQGAQSEIFADWRRRLVEMMGAIEAEIDFPDEFSVSEPVDGIQISASILADEISLRLSTETEGEKLRVGLTVAVVGSPNVGKSTLINALCCRDVSIVSSSPGTTRDIVEARMALGGVPMTLLDTAGLREGGGPIEREGMRRAQEKAATADLVLIVSDGVAPDPVLSLPDDLPRLKVRNKVDVGASDDSQINVSAVYGNGMEALRAAVTEQVQRLTRGRSIPSMTRPRHRAALIQVRDHLREACSPLGAEFVAEELRLAARSLGHVTGDVGAEDVLDLVFSQFCIGK